MDSVKILAVRFALCLALVVLIGFWVAVAHAQSPWLSGLSLLVAAAALFWGIQLGMALKRALLWRRRRSVRPSREIQAERRRIALDLHDAVGAQLVQVQLALKGNHLDAVALTHARKLLDQTLLDLRLIVDSMDSSDDPLALRLARLRHRFQPVLEQHGIALHWEVEDSDQVPDLPRGGMAHDIMSIVQEALSNALQHSRAACIGLQLKLEDGRWQLKITDDGVGLHAPSEVGRGMGLANMKRRAIKAGGDLQLSNMQPHGTQVVLRWMP